MEPCNFTCVGFSWTPDEFESVLERAVRSGTRTFVPQGSYVRWSPGGGAELWLHVAEIDGAPTIVSVMPHFAGAARFEVSIAATSRNRSRELTGCLFAWAEPQADEGETFPLLVSVPDFAAQLRDLELPARATLECVGFASSLGWWEGRDDFVRFADPREPHDAFAVTPIGLDVREEGAPESTLEPEPTAIVAGRIETATSKINPVTGLRYYHLRVVALGYAFDVLADPRTVEGEPQAGAYVRATCWMSARLARARTAPGVVQAVR